MSFIKNNFETVLREFFKLYKPQHMDKVPDFLEEFNGQEAFCIKSLCDRYYVDYNKFIKKFDADIEELPDQERIVLKEFKGSESVSNNSSDDAWEEDNQIDETIDTPKKKSKLPLIIIILVVILGSAGAFLFMGGESETIEPSPDENNTEVIDSSEAMLEKAELIEETEELADTSNLEVMEEAIDTTTVEQSLVEENDTTAEE